MSDFCCILQLQEGYKQCSKCTIGLFTRVCGLELLRDSLIKFQNLVHLSEAPPPIEGYGANVTCGSQPHVKVQERYLPSF
jgi:hypothetical protein